MVFEMGSGGYLRLQWQGNLYEFLCLCFSLGCAPTIFTKLMKILITLARHLNERLFYLNKNLFMASMLEETMMLRDTLIFVWQNLGFAINFQKSVLNPSHQIIFLDVEIDSLAIYDSIPSITKQETNHLTMPGSIEPIRFLIMANESTGRLSFINSNSSSSSTFPVPILKTSNNFWVSRKKKFHCAGRVIRSYGGNSVVDTKQDTV